MGTIHEVNEDADLYLDNLTDPYFENTSKRVLVKNAYIMGKLSSLDIKTDLLNELNTLYKENLENKIETLKLQKRIASMYEQYSGYGDDYADDTSSIQKEIDKLEKELESINEIKLVKKSKSFNLNAYLEFAKDSTDLD